MARSHILMVIWGTVEIITFGGIIFGWASLVYIFKLEGYFEDHCDRNTTGDLFATNLTSPSQIGAEHESVHDYPASPLGPNSTIQNHFTDFPPGCDAQDRLFNLVYVLAVVINGISTFPNGVLWDKFGTRFLRCLGIVAFCLGTLMIAFSSPGSAVILFPAMILIAYGGYILMMTNFQLGNLIPTKKSLIISLYCGAYDSSAFMLILVKWAYSAGLIMKYSFLILLAMFTTVVLSTFWFIPSKGIPFPLPRGYLLTFDCKCQKREIDENEQAIAIDIKESTDTKDCSEAREDGPEPTGQEIIDLNKKSLLVKANKTKTDTEDKAFLKEVVSALFIWDMIWLTLMRFQSWSFVGRLNPALERLAGGDQQIVSQYTSVYACLQFFGICFAPLSGRLMDRKKNRQVDPRLKRIEMIEVCIASFVIDNTLGLLLAITMTVPVIQVQYVSFVFHVIHRALLYGPNTAFIAQAFSSKNFGKLFGLAMTVSAFFSLLQFPLFLMVQGPLNGDPFVFNILVLVLMVLAYGHPIYLTVWCRRKRKHYLHLLANGVEDPTPDKSL